MGLGWRSIRAKGLPVDCFMHAKFLRLAGLNKIHFPDAPGQRGGQSSTTHIRLPNICFRQINKFIHFWWHCKWGFVWMWMWMWMSHRPITRGLCASVLSANFISYCQSRSDMLLAISSKRKCTLAFLQRKLSPERNGTKRRMWKWKWLGVGEIRCHYLCNANCAAGHLPPSNWVLLTVDIT